MGERNKGRSGVREIAKWGQIKKERSGMRERQKETSGEG